MYLAHMFGLMYHPKEEWSDIKNENYTISHVYLSHLIYLAALPPLALLIGTTQIGWSLNGTNYLKLNFESAIPIAIIFYFALLAGVWFMAFCVHWMEKTFGADASMERCVVFTAFTSTPMFFAGMAGLLPILWLDFFVVLGAVVYTVYLLYLGVPIFMNIPEERGFIFASSILTVGLCVLVGMMAITVILWSMGLQPGYTPA